MRVWMIAEASLYTRLQQERVLFADPALAMPDFEGAYAWMRGKMTLRLPHYQGHWPWWAWVRPPCGHARPDLRARWAYHNGWPTGTACVRLGLDTPDADVLLSDFDMWHAVLNNSPLVSSDEEWDAIEALPEAERQAARETTGLVSSRSTSHRIPSGMAHARPLCRRVSRRCGWPMSEKSPCFTPGLPTTEQITHRCPEHHAPPVQSGAASATGEHRVHIRRQSQSSAIGVSREKPTLIRGGQEAFSTSLLAA